MGALYWLDPPRIYASTLAKRTADARLPFLLYLASPGNRSPGSRTSSSSDQPPFSIVVSERWSPVASSFLFPCKTSALPAGSKPLSRTNTVFCSTATPAYV